MERAHGNAPDPLFSCRRRGADFTRAAASCTVTQPALTRAIRKLEEELAGPLLRREGRHTHLTELGRVVRPRFEQALSSTELARDEAPDFSRMVNARLDLGCMCTLAPSSMISLIAFFCRRAPPLTLDLHEASRSELAEQPLADELDVAITALPIFAAELEALPLFEERCVIALPRGHRFAQMAEVPLAALAGERYLERQNCEDLDMFEAAGLTFDVETDERFKSQHESWVQAMVIAGLGCVIMPESLALHRELRSRPLVKSVITRTISVVNLCKRMGWGVRPTRNAARVLQPTA